jgi:hypothetical protein
MRRGELPFGAVALLTESVMMAVSVNLDARVHRLTVRAFSEEAPAVKWLVTVEPRPGSWRPPQSRPLSVAPPPRKD